MSPSNDFEEKVANKVEEIHELEIEALRRAGVAKEKEQGLEIESTEAVRLFRQASGYILRLRELREDIEGVIPPRRNPNLPGDPPEKRYHAEQVIGLIDDYNRILKDIRRNEAFENAVANFAYLSYSENKMDFEYEVNLDGRIDTFPTRHGKTHTSSDETVPMDGTTKVEKFVLPRLVRLTKDMETSLIGRCVSGK